MRAAVVVLLVLACACTRDDSPSQSTASASATTAPSAASALPTAVSESPTPTASPTPAPTPSPTATPTPSEPEETVVPTAAPANDLALLKRRLVTGKEMGPGWSSAVVEGGDDHESGDLCGTTKEGETNQLGSVSAELTHENEVAVQGAVQHEIARYRPGTAGSVAAAITARLRQCKGVEHDFDGDKGLVTVTPTGANKATFSVDFGGGGGTTFGALVVSQVGDYVSTSTSFAINTATAAKLAGQLDVAARKKLAAAH